MKVLIFTTYRCKLSDQIFSFQRMFYLIVIEWESRTMKELETILIITISNGIEIIEKKTNSFFSDTNVPSLIATLETKY